MRTLLLCLTVTLITIAPLRAAGPYTLVHKAHAEKVSYWILSVDRTETQLRQGAPQKEQTALLMQIEQSRTATTTGTIAEVLRPLSMEGAADGKAVPPSVLPRTTTSHSLKPSGEPIDPPERGPADALTPVFPAAAISPGHTWNAVVPPSKKLLVELTVVHKLEKVEVVDGVECAVISSRGEVKGRMPDGSATFGVRLEGSTSFDLAAGVVHRASSEIRMLVKRAKPSAKGSVAHVLKSNRQIKRIRSGDDAPPKPPVP